MTKRKPGSSPVTTPHIQAALTALKDEDSLHETMALLGIPAAERTGAVKLAISTLLEKLEDLGQEVKHAQERFSELEKLVDVDCIAPVPNRRAFMRRLSWAISMFERYGHPCSIIYFDINWFKNINDQFGHAAGDMAIRHISDIIGKSLRASDFMARIGGDEFAIVMYYATSRAAQERGNAISAAIAATPMLWEKRHLTVTSAFGAYEIQTGDDAERALSQADTAMYRNKRLFKEAVPDASAQG